MPESAYKALKEKALSVLQFKNKSISLAVFIGVNLLFVLTGLFRLSFIFMISLILMTITMVSLFVGFLGQTITPDTTPGFEAKQPEEVDSQGLQFACSVMFDLMNDAVQALRNIIILKDVKSVIVVLFPRNNGFKQTRNNHNRYWQC